MAEELTIYNFNLGLYGVMRITFELAPAGDWIQTFDIDVLLQRRPWSKCVTLFQETDGSRTLTYHDSYIQLQRITADDNR